MMLSIARGGEAMLLHRFQAMSSDYRGGLCMASIFSMVFVYRLDMIASCIDIDYDLERICNESVHAHGWYPVVLPLSLASVVVFSSIAFDLRQTVSRYISKSPYLCNCSALHPTYTEAHFNK